MNKKRKNNTIYFMLFVFISCNRIIIMSPLSNFEKIGNDFDGYWLLEKNNIKQNAYFKIKKKNELFLELIACTIIPSNDNIVFDNVGIVKIGTKMILHYGSKNKGYAIYDLEKISVNKYKLRTYSTSFIKNAIEDKKIIGKISTANNYSTILL